LKCRQLLEQVVALEVGEAAVEVYRAARREAALLEVGEPDAPRALRDRLLAVAARSARARRALGAVDARQAAVRRRAPRGAFERLALGQIRGRRREHLEQRFGPLPRRAHRVEPQRHLALAERLRQALAQAQAVLGDRLAAAAAPGAAGRGGLEHVGHGSTIARRPTARVRGLPANKPQQATSRAESNRGSRATDRAARA
jgi:hypothetical protein